ncbi:MAG: sugar phosphate isomerase/epimerase [Candidatus Lokiarchaeota archaeon]|nr:sugar phosphate isomerase/epimerase [Candidatus Lokiarchaeota archaeon]
MKTPLSIVIGIDSNFLNKFDETIKAKFDFLKDLDYTGVELALLRPEDIPVDKINAYLESYNMKISAIGTGSTFLRYGYSLSAIDDKMREKAIKRMDLYCKLASELIGNPKVILGLIRGRRSYNQNQESEITLFKKSLSLVDEIAEKYNIELVIEPINQFEIDFLHTLSEVVDLLQEVNLSSTFAMIDSFHVYLEEDSESFYQNLEKYAPYIHHVHFAGPDRRAMKAGEIDYEKIIHTLFNNSYGGFFSIEAIMKPSFESVAKQSSEYISNIF